MVCICISPNRYVDCLVNLFDYIRIVLIPYGTRKDQIVLFSTQTAVEWKTSSTKLGHLCKYITNECHKSKRFYLTLKIRIVRKYLATSVIFETALRNVNFKTQQVFTFLTDKHVFPTILIFYYFINYRNNSTYNHLITHV